MKNIEQSDEVFNEILDDLIKHFKNGLMAFDNNCKKFVDYLKEEKQESIINIELPPFIDGSLIELTPEVKVNFINITLNRIVEFAKNLNLEIPKKTEKKIIGWVRMASNAGALSPGCKWTDYLYKKLKPNARKHQKYYRKNKS
jgi:hypothetical protein